MDQKNEQDIEIVVFKDEKTAPTHTQADNTMANTKSQFVDKNRRKYIEKLEKQAGYRVMG